MKQLESYKQELEAELIGMLITLAFLFTLSVGCLWSLAFILRWWVIA
jgi:hypothetical protein